MSLPQCRRTSGKKRCGSFGGLHGATQRQPNVWRTLDAHTPGGKAASRRTSNRGHARCSHFAYLRSPCRYEGLKNFAIVDP